MAKNKDQAPEVKDQASDKEMEKEVDTSKLKGLVAEACKAFGIGAEFLFNSRVDGDEVVLVTNGGKKVRYKSGDEVEPLDDIAVTGVNPAAKKRKVIAGKAKD